MMPVKDMMKFFLQELLGYDNYLYWFARFCIARMGVGDYEKSFVYFMDMMPAKDATILDIGANIGIMSVSLAKRFPQSTIFSFEPIPSNIHTLKKVVAKYRLKNITIIEKALGEKNDEIKMVLPVINYSKRQGLSHVWQEGNNEEWNIGELYTVPVTRLDDVNQLMQQKKISAMKIDVEDYEFNVLQGAKELIEKYKPIIYTELWQNGNRIKCINFLKELGYEVKVFRENSLIDYTSQREINFFFIPKQN
jgi:FkbM family methyltransferase